MSHYRRQELRENKSMFLAILTSGLVFVILPAYAAPLNFTSATPLVLTSPSTTLTIATGSVADTLTVNATSVVVGLSATTGGTFALLSPDYNLSVATTSAGGTATFTCSGSATTLTLSQTSGATTYTITPASGSCSPTGSASSTPSSPVSVQVGGSGYPPPSFLIDGGAGSTASSRVTLSFTAPPAVASFVITTAHGNEQGTATSSYASSMPLNLCAGLASCPAGNYLVSVDFLDKSGAFLASSSQAIGYTAGGTSPVATATSSAPSNAAPSTIAVGSSTMSQLETLLASLEAELQTLLKEAAAKGIVIQGLTSSNSSASPYVFTRNLTLWDRGQDVNELQRYLVAGDKGPAAEALAKHGTTETFGPLTFAALKEFQKAVGIVPDSGYFGPITRGYIRTHGE